jgi:hypothetical protein
MEAGGTRDEDKLVWLRDISAPQSEMLQMSVDTKTSSWKVIGSKTVYDSVSLSYSYS